MKLPIYQVDAFTKKVFAGNPAAVVPLPDWLPDNTLQAIAAENNLSETAFIVKKEGGYDLRWFTPVMEVDLCGHATLASAFVLFDILGSADKSITFSTKSGKLTVTNEGNLLTMDFPSRPPVPCPTPADLIDGLGKVPIELLRSRDYFAVFSTEQEIKSLTPDFTALARLDCTGITVTARSTHVDFVSRFFAPQAGIPEDPVTGSAHCSLIPYWAEKLGKKKLHALQVSARGGELFCEDMGERVKISGNAVVFFSGMLEV